jgi:hypothetical protein
MHTTKKDDRYLRVPADLFIKLGAIAEAEDRSTAATARHILRAAIARWTTEQRTHEDVR